MPLNTGTKIEPKFDANLEAMEHKAKVVARR